MVCVALRRQPNEDPSQCRVYMAAGRIEAGNLGLEQQAIARPIVWFTPGKTFDPCVGSQLENGWHEIIPIVLARPSSVNIRCLVVGVVIARGTDGMHHFEVTSTYDNGPTVVVDSLPIGADNFEFDKTIITRDVPGTEKWSFVVVENDGDLIRRSLTFVVE